MRFSSLAQNLLSSCNPKFSVCDSIKDRIEAIRCGNRPLNIFEYKILSYDSVEERELGLTLMLELLSEQDEASEIYEQSPYIYKQSPYFESYIKIENILERKFQLHIRESAWYFLENRKNIDLIGRSKVLKYDAEMKQDELSDEKALTVLASIIDEIFLAPRGSLDEEVFTDMFFFYKFSIFGFEVVNFFNNFLYKNFLEIEQKVLTKKIKGLVEEDFLYLIGGFHCGFRRVCLNSQYSETVRDALTLDQIKIMCNQLKKTIKELPSLFLDSHSEFYETFYEKKFLMDFYGSYYKFLRLFLNEIAYGLEECKNRDISETLEILTTLEKCSDPEIDKVFISKLITKKLKNAACNPSLSRPSKNKINFTRLKNIDHPKKSLLQANVQKTKRIEEMRTIQKNQHKKSVTFTTQSSKHLYLTQG